MIDLPTPETLATVVDETSQAMFGVAIEYAGAYANRLPSCQASSPTVIVPLIGNPLYIITAHAGSVGGAALASAMFTCEAKDTSNEMVEDSLRELCNIVAGQVKSLIAQEHEIGLPSRLTDDDTMKDVQQWSGARLRIGPQQAEVNIGVAEFPGLG